MAKALKIAGLAIAGVGLIVATGGLAAGFGLATVLGASSGVLGLTIGSVILGGLAISSIGGALATPKVPAAQTDRLTASIDPRAFRKTVLGQTAMPVDVRYEEWSGADQEYCDWIVAVASHGIDGIDEIWIDTEMAWSATTGVTAKYVGYFSIPNMVLEGSPANAFTFASGKWNAATARLTGCAYLRLRFKVTGNGKKAESPFSSGVPTRITIIGRGAKLYDPRRDSTVPGGSGPMRADDQSTWRFTADDGAVIGENLPLQILREVMGWRIRNPVTNQMKLAVGSGVPARRIDMMSFIVAANQADEQVNRSAGGTEARYVGAAVTSEGDEPKTRLDMLCAGCCGRFRDTGGKLALVLSHNDLATAALDDGLDDDDVVGGFTWDPDASLDATPNIIRGRYTDASTGSLYQMIDYPEVQLPSLDGQDRIFPLDLGAVESPSQAQRVAKQVLQRKQYPREFTSTFDIRAWKYGVGDVVPFTFAALGFDRRVFRVKDQELGQGSTCAMTLTVEHPSIYAWDKDDVAPVLAAEPNAYDSSKNPLILAIGEAATTANWDGVTGVGKPADNADVTGDNTAGDTVAVYGRPAAAVVSDLDLNGRNWFDLAELESSRDALMLARTTLLGQPIGTVVTAFKDEFHDEKRATAETFALIGAKAGDGSSFLLDQSTVKVGPADGGSGPVQSLGQRFQSINVTLGGVTGSISDLQTVLVDSQGAISAKAVFALDVAGRVVGMVSTNTGRVGSIEMLFDSYNFLTPAGDSIFSYADPAVGGDGILRMQNVAVDKLTYGALEEQFNGDNQLLNPAGGFQVLPGGFVIQWGQVRQNLSGGFVTVEFPVPFKTALMAVSATPFVNGRGASNQDMWVQINSNRSNSAFEVLPHAGPSGQNLNGFDWMAFGR